MNLSKQFLGANEVDETKIRLSNSGFLRARNSANTADLNLIRLNSSDRLEVGDLEVRGWVKKTITYSQFSDPSTVKNLVLEAFNAGYLLEAYAWNLTVPFTGGAVSAATISFGRGSAPTELTTFDVFTATAQQAPSVVSVAAAFDAADDTIQLQLNTTDDNIDQLTAGSIDFYYLVKNLNADVAGGVAPGGTGAKVNAPSLTMSGETQVLFTSANAEHNLDLDLLTANTMKVRKPGIYLINLTGTITSGSVSNVTLGYKINGGTTVWIVDEVTSNAGSATYGLNSSMPLILAENDLVTFYAQSSVDDTPMDNIVAALTLLAGSGGSGATAAGVDGNIQFNSSSGLGADSLLNWSTAASSLVIGSPSSISGRLEVYNAGNDGDIFFVARGSGGGDPAIMIKSNSGVLNLQGTSGAKAGAVDMVLQLEGGNVAIGKSTPTAMLDVAGSINVDGQANAGSFHGTGPLEVTAQSGYVRLAVNGGGTYLEWDGSSLHPLTGAFNMSGSAFALTAGSQTWNLDGGGGFSNSSGGMTISAVGNLTLNANGGSQSMTWSSAGLVPTVDGSLSLGDASHRWQNVFANQINGGNSTLAVSTNSVQFVFDGTNNTFRGQTNFAQDLGTTSLRWRTAYAQKFSSGTSSNTLIESNGNSLTWDGTSLTPPANASNSLGSASLRMANVYANNVLGSSLNLLSAGTSSGVVSGAVTLATGDQSGTAASGAMTIKTGTTGAGDVSGNISLFTGNSSNGTGDISILTGTASGGGSHSGNLTIGTGTATATRGHITMSALYLQLPTGTSDPTATEGSVYYNTSTHKLRLYDGTSWVSLN